MPPPIELGQRAERFRDALLKSPQNQVEGADRVDFAAMLARALAERAEGRGALPDLIGLDRASLNALAKAYFLDADLPDLDCERIEPSADQRSLALLMRWRGAPNSTESLWFADILARRAMEPHHLWEDLGLPERPRLTALMQRRFPRLVALNAANMRWKKFFSRQICADASFSLCLAPSCEECPERSLCFPPEGAAPTLPAT
ncbi:nitrogen fixation protein NifQ [Consotaella salsifontis]|uniref:Nitrogen fixation protein NifQ n=1 Tax=Consotaella salsifontis TaxID=1365950 RepID=A0A1T4S914_9HYPH|nr:nitrogen fixation protein NifQ [Consotaella salsifontis]SKA24667.1 nitrogen fixation protein NifQ [Consotaella salsifontis]